MNVTGILEENLESKNKFLISLVEEMERREKEMKRQQSKVPYLTLPKLT
jgi:hypothetical protein